MIYTKILLPRPVGEEVPISAPFGYGLLQGQTRFHKGIDFACPIGTKVYAVSDGKAVRAGWENPKNKKEGYGLRIMQAMTWAGIGFFCWYGHLSEVLVDPDEEIFSGQLIGISGNTGHSTGPHLHFGIRQADTNKFYDVEWQSGIRWGVA
jgi:murein DD-endopeptidase MepM/ murein hydrolase activator NlpD